MATIRAQEERIIGLKQEVQEAWRKACYVEGIKPLSKFVVFADTDEARAYNKLAGVYLDALRTYNKQQARNTARRNRHAAYTDLGLKRVKGALGGTYYE